jgi:hypothetical protein
MAVSAVDEELAPPQALGPRVRRDMFGLFAAHYDGVRRETFERDLADKDLVILLRGADGRLLGFTTLAICDLQVDSRCIRYIFSGDTVMDSRHWGRGHLLRSWFRVAGAIKAQAPRRTLYWFLIVKGHRTYRILENFFRNYAPRPTRGDDPKLVKLRDTLATRRFGTLYNPATGLIEFPVSRGQLAKRLQDAHEHASRPLVRDFLTLNPNYAQGVELACVAELDESNLKSYAARAFRGGCRGG